MDYVIDEYEEEFYAEIEERNQRQKEMTDNVQDYLDDSSNGYIRSNN